MPQRDLVIGIDSSTTSCKAIIWDMQGSALAMGRAPLPMLKPQPAWHEQPAGSWWEAAQHALNEAVASIDTNRLAALCITAQRETFVVTDEVGQPLAPAMLWMDERCRDLLPELDQRYGKQRIHQETGKPLSANLTSGKLYWLRQKDSALFSRIARVMDVHAFLVHRLTGQFFTSWGCADPLGLFDMRQNAWNATLIDSIGLSVEQFPAAVPVGSVIGEVTPAAARLTGLPAGLPVIAGTGDGQAAGLGTGTLEPGEAYLNLGTAVVSGAFSERYLVDPAFRTHYGCVPGSYSLETVLLGGTYTISWFIENFARLDPDAPTGKSPEEIYEAAAAQISPGALGLTLVPYWNSAMNPYWDAGASGIVVGWRGIHTSAHLYRAILEGIALEQRLHTGGVEQVLQSLVERYIAVGGGARSRLWRQIIASVTGKPVYHSDTPEASALGAGILAAAAAGFFPDVRQAAQAMTHRTSQPDEPEPEQHRFYSKLYEDVYRHLFPSLQPYLDRLSDLTMENPL